MVPAMNPAAIKSRVAAHPFWYHRIELPGGVITPGYAPISPPSYAVPEDLSGKRVLDVGAWDGYWSFEALKRGAREVVAIDDFSDFLGQLENSDRHAWETFDLCREALGYGDDVCARREMSVYEVNEAELGRFDYVFCFGLLYHLRHPLLALDKLSAVCDEAIFVESAILDDFSPYRGGMGHGYAGGQFVMEFYPTNEYGRNDTNWWVPTGHCLAAMVRAAGFPRVDAQKLAKEPKELPHCRGFVQGYKRA